MVDGNKEQILFLTSGFPKNPDDTTARFIFDLARYVSRDGYSVVILAPLINNAIPQETWENLKIFRFVYFIPQNLMRLAYGDGMIHNCKKSLLAILQIPFFLLAQFGSAYKIIKREQIPIIHAHWLLPQGICAILLRRFLPVQVIITVHGSDIRSFPRFITKPILKHADAIISPHPELSQILEDMGIKYYEIPNITDDDIFSPSEGSNSFKHDLNISTKFVVTFVARLNEFKDPLTFIRSIPHVIEKEPDVTFLVAGDGPLREKLEIEVNNLTISEHVRILGNRNDINRILNITTIFTALSPFENIWSLVLIEAMKSGVPCIVTEVGYSSKKLQNSVHAMIIPPRDQIALAEAIIDLLETPEKRTTLSRNGIRLMESQFSIESILEKYRNVIADLKK